MNDDKESSIPRSSDRKVDTIKNSDDQLSQLLSATTGPFGDIGDGSLCSPFLESQVEMKPAVFQSSLLNDKKGVSDSLFKDEEGETFLNTQGRSFNTGEPVKSAKTAAPGLSEEAMAKVKVQSKSAINDIET